MTELDEQVTSCLDCLGISSTVIQRCKDVFAGHLKDSRSDTRWAFGEENFHHNSKSLVSGAHPPCFWKSSTSGRNSESYPYCLILTFFSFCPVWLFYSYQMLLAPKKIILAPEAPCLFSHIPLFTRFAIVPKNKAKNQNQNENPSIKSKSSSRLDDLLWVAGTVMCLI